MGKEQRSGPAFTSKLDYHVDGQGDVRAPLRAIPAQPTPPSITKEHIIQNDGKLPGQRWPSPNKDVKPLESFELEDNTTGSGGTSWTLRVPWLRNKRPRKQRLDDENSSIGTELSRSINKSILGPGSEDQEALYYGGLMKTSSPTFVSVEAEQIEALEGDGLYRVENSGSLDSGVPQQLKQTGCQSGKQKHKRSRNQRQPRCADLKMNHNLLPQHVHNSPQLPVNAFDNDGTNTRRNYYLDSQPPHLVPKNNNKVFRNRSWISTSSRNSEGRKTDDDSLADFDETEWTPQDSAYGAAIPICGCVPKRLRQGIEATIIAITVFALVYLVVTTSISISESKSGGSHHLSYNDTYFSSGVKNYDNKLKFDDDYYIENSQYQNDWYVENSQYHDDEDDYFTTSNSNNNGGGKGNGNDGK